MPRCRSISCIVTRTLYPKRWWKWLVGIGMASGYFIASTLVRNRIFPLLFVSLSPSSPAPSIALHLFLFHLTLSPSFPPLLPSLFTCLLTNLYPKLLKWIELNVVKIKWECTMSISFSVFNSSLPTHPWCPAYSFNSD